MNNTPERIWIYQRQGVLQVYSGATPSDGVAYVRADLLEQVKGEHEKMYANLSDRFQANQRDLNDAQARIAELEKHLKVARDHMLND